MSQNTSNMPNKKSRASVMFAKGTKGDSAQAAARQGPNLPRSSTGSAYDGFGALMDEYSDNSDDDSDDGRLETSPSAPQSANGQRPHHNAVRESWGARAMAVGERPPDSMSQNPPTLKLLGLKSQREGGQALGRGVAPSAAHSAAAGWESARSNPPTRGAINEQSVSEYGDNASRIGSTIDFTGHGSDGFGGQSVVTGKIPLVETASNIPQPKPHANSRPEEKSRKALTAQLGLDTPLPTHPASPEKYAAHEEDYFTISHRGDGRPGEVPLSRSQHPTSPGFRATQVPPSARVHDHSPSDVSASLGSSPSTSSIEKKDPFNQSSPPSRSLVVGPQTYGNNQQQMSPPGFRDPRAPPAVYARPNGPSPPFDPRRPMDSSDPRGAPPQALRPGMGQAGFVEPQRRGPPPVQHQQKRQSLFRRSMALVTGADPDGQAQSSRGAGPQKRQSIFRRSMAFLSGKPQMPEPEPAVEDHPAPKVRGFDGEKAVDPRKSQYLGGGGQGHEWDVDGAGAKFWARFDSAQQHANSNDKMELTSRTFRQKVAARRKLATCMAGLGGMLIISAVIGIVIWREGAASNNESAPGSINKGNHGGTDTRQRRSPIQTPAADVAFAGAAWAGVERANDVWAGAKVERAPVAAPPVATPAQEALPRARPSGFAQKRIARHHSHLQAEARHDS